MFFEKHLQEARKRLAAAQSALESSGFSAGALKAEPRAAAESYAQLKAEATAAEIRLQALRNGMTDAAPEVRQQQATVAALRAELARAEQSANRGDDSGFVERFREFKYQETLFDLFARQYELARVDESREGSLIQVVDAATPPDKRSKPERRRIATITAAATLLLLALAVLLHGIWRRARTDPLRADAAARLSAAFRLRRRP
jgi:capsule polysaccharide export protein KpsE/RkpR